MKKTAMLMLAIASFQALFAQSARTKTEALFSGPTAPGKSDIRFDFQLDNGNRLMLEFSSIAQVDALPDIDSLLRTVWIDLENFSDSLNTPLANKRVDYVISEQDKKIRIIQYPQQGASYTIRKEGILQLKIEQDTLRIRLATPRPGKIIGMDGPIATDHPYYITLLLNNISELPALLERTSLSPAITVLRADLAPTRKPNRINQRYYGSYDISGGKPAASVDDLLISYQPKLFNRFFPCLQFAFQYANGGWAPSAGAGFQYTSRPNEDRQWVVKLYAETFAFFNRDVANKVVTERNTFITFRYNAYSKAPQYKDVWFARNVSAGWLIHREGPWFDKKCFKLGLLGVQSRSLLLEPELIYNLSETSAAPSLKLTYFFW